LTPDAKDENKYDESDKNHSHESFWALRKSTLFERQSLNGIASKIKMRSHVKGSTSTIMSVQDHAKMMQQVLGLKPSDISDSAYARRFEFKAPHEY
jgi:hypothetical protein